MRKKGGRRCGGLVVLALLALRLGQASGATPQATKAKPKAYIHVGSHKVASTAIQIGICHLRGPLAAQGVTVPLPEHPTCAENGPCVKHFASVAAALWQVPESSSIPNAATESGTNKFHCLNRAGEEVGAVASLRETLRETVGDVLLSSEVFDELSPHGVAYLADVFQDYDVHILIMYREVLDRIVSCYVEAMKRTKRTQDMSSYILGFGSSHRCGASYPELLEAYTGVFGSDKVVVASYDGLRAVGRDVLDFVIGTFAQREMTPEIRNITAHAGSTANVSPPAAALSLWSFLQGLWMLERPKQRLPNFPWWGARRACMPRIFDAMVDVLGEAWLCFDAPSYVATYTAQDLGAIQRHGVHTFYFEDATAFGNGSYPAPRVQVCGVRPERLNPRRSPKASEQLLHLTDDALRGEC